MANHNHHWNCEILPLIAPAKNYMDNDSSLTGYGQVMRSSRFGGADAVTMRAGLDIDMPELPNTHLSALLEHQRELDAIHAKMRQDEQDGENDGYAGRPMQQGRSYDYNCAYKSAVNAKNNYLNS